MEVSLKHGCPECKKKWREMVEKAERTDKNLGTNFTELVAISVLLDFCGHEFSEPAEV